MILVIIKILILFSRISIGVGTELLLEPLELDSETKEYIFSKAEKFSKITNFKSELLPPIYLVSKKSMGAIVCPNEPERCRGIAAVFDDINYRILLNSDLKVTSSYNPFNESFLIHEVVHVLQYLKWGPKIFENCEALFETESLAYSVQDQFLKEEGEFFRASQALKYFYCDESVALVDYQQSLEAWMNKQGKFTVVENE